MNAGVQDGEPDEPAVGWLRGVIVDALDVERLAAFWQHVLGVGVAERVPGWLQLKFGAEGSLIAFQPADPIAHAPGRLRIDIEVEDLEAATTRIVALGGALKEIVRFRPGEEHRVMTDPEGNEFSIVSPFPPGLTVR
ncbi:MAG: VOC family protein [Acidimicrobiia bacterium]|nr:VOC family protein [Acidimicrobiia bacterium]